MDKEFVPCEQAVELKELGFDEPCFGYYKPNGELDYIENHILKDFPYLAKNSEWQDLAAAPTFSQAFRWFREKYGYFTSPTESDDDTSKKYDWLITKNLGDGKMFIKLIGYKNSYEEAELECLKKLIEIAKEK
jgi:hypothetical protein